MTSPVTTTVSVPAIDEPTAADATTSDAPPLGSRVSWLVIEKGWRVLATDGREVGAVSGVTGDVSGDIFDGLVFRPHPAHEARYVAAENVASITEGAVTLDLGAAEIEKLDTLDHVFPGGASRGQRMERWLRRQAF